tara:strand:+ start:543 stop:848 length:306 start_codon:yes stop_codon:yes gene_type:complete
MKHSIKFNHDASNVGETFGVDLDGLSSRLSKVICIVLFKDFMEGDEYTKRSHMAEIIADRLTQEEILFLALEQAETIVKKFEKKLEKVNDLLEKIMQDDED